MEKKHVYFPNRIGYNKINYKNGDLDITNWKTIYQHLKNKRIKLNNTELNFSKFQKLFKKSKSGTIEIWEKEIFDLNEYRKELKKLQLNPKNTTIQELISLWEKRKLVKDKYIRKSFKKIIYENLL